MNVVTGIMLVFAIVGLLDKTFSLKLNLNVAFDKGMSTIGTMIIPIVGVCTIGVEFIERHEDFFVSISDVMPFDPSMIIGAILAPDLGGYFISKAIASSTDLLILNGVVLGTLMGQAICFQIPVFLASINKEDKPNMLKGFLVGISVIPLGLLIAEVFLRINFIVFLKQFVPILILCMLVALGLYKIPGPMIKGFMILGRLIQIVTNLMFLLAVLGIFVPWLRYADMDSVQEAILIVVKSAIIIAGALVLTEIILKFFRKHIKAFAERIGSNEISVVSMLMNCATSLAILPVFEKMDENGKKMNSAFSISGAYVIGGSMAFVSTVESGYVLMVFIVCKLVCGLVSMVLIRKMK